MGLLSRLGAAALGGVCMVIPGAQPAGAVMLAWSVRPPDPIEFAIAAGLHPTPLLGFILS